MLPADKEKPLDSTPLTRVMKTAGSTFTGCHIRFGSDGYTERAYIEFRSRRPSKLWHTTKALAYISPAALLWILYSNALYSTGITLGAIAGMTLLLLIVAIKEGRIPLRISTANPEIIQELRNKCVSTNATPSERGHFYLRSSKDIQNVAEILRPQLKA